MPKFPRDLADAVCTRWDKLVAGEYVTPPCPPRPLLRNIFESCYLAASAPEESRYPQFNVVVSERGTSSGSLEGITTYPFHVSRPMELNELRRLAPATDMRKSAIWVTWDEKSCEISGLCDLGTSWHRARMGLAYSYMVPSSLIVQVDRPGRMKIYQGQYAVASLTDGELSLSDFDLHLFLHESINRGQERIYPELKLPEVEHPRDYENFWFIAHWNVFAAIANTISTMGHGGTLIIAAGDDALGSLVRIKYPSQSDALQKAFIGFLNARNRTADIWERIESGDELPADFHEAERILNHASDGLVEATRFVAQLAGCDGAIVLTDDLRLLGFGAEIRSELDSSKKIREVRFEFGDKHRSCDIEQFGMRHRSALKLASQLSEVCILAISQDGPISAVWSKGSEVLLKKGVALSNKNMPYS